MRFLISGVAFSGNKGAAGMAEALIRNLAERDSEVYFLVFSYYPIADAELRIPERVKILDGSPKRVVLLFSHHFWQDSGGCCICRAAGMPGAKWERLPGAISGWTLPESLLWTVVKSS